jgi:creatinine amidohydrolase
MIRDLSIDYPDFLIATSEWFTFVPAKEYFDEPGDHADELETSVMMHYHPELVDLDEAGDGKSKKFASQMLNEKVAWIPRNWLKVSEDTGIGNPKKATAEKGRKYAEAVTAKYAQLFKELTEEIY